MSGQQGLLVMLLYSVADFEGAIVLIGIFIALAIGASIYFFWKLQSIAGRHHVLARLPLHHQRLVDIARVFRTRKRLTSFRTEALGRHFWEGEASAEPMFGRARLLPSRCFGISVWRSSQLFWLGGSLALPKASPETITTNTKQIRQKSQSRFVKHTT